MFISDEFADYLTTPSVLTPDEQMDRANEMRVDEIFFRAKMMAGLNFDRELAKIRLKKNYQWSYEFGDLPPFYKSIDSLVDGVYDKLKL